MCIASLFPHVDAQSISLDELKPGFAQYALRARTQRARPNDRGYPLGMADSEPEACWCAVVKEVHRKPIEADDLAKAVDHVGNVVECVSEFFPRRHVGLTEPGKVRRDHMKSIGEQRDQVTKHVARAREAVQQQQLRRAGWPRFAIKDLETIDIGRAISHWCHETLLCLQHP
jgi:hypothetical protein